PIQKGMPEDWEPEGLQKSRKDALQKPQNRKMFFHC
ncbi:MAG: hypothetical protein ACI9R3_002236, partial [Verrucomicrobiales bacterium]